MFYDFILQVGMLRTLVVHRLKLMCVVVGYFRVYLSHEGLGTMFDTIENLHGPTDDAEVKAPFVLMLDSDWFELPQTLVY